MPHDDRDYDPARLELARQVLAECERRGLYVWQQFGVAYVARRAGTRLVPAPQYWQRTVYRLANYIADLLDADCGWGCTVHRVPGTECLVYRPAAWHPPSDQLQAMQAAQDGRAA